MKRVLLPILVIGVLLLSACGAPSVEAPPSEQPAPTPEEPAAPVETPPPTEQPAPAIEAPPTAPEPAPAPTPEPMPSEKPEPPLPPAEAATEVGGIISSNTTWTAEKSPYEITETIQIPEGVTLTIEPGVIVNKPASGDMFLLMGTIRAHGTAQESIVFDGGGNSTIVGTHPGHGYGDFEFGVFKNGYSLWDRWGHLTLRYSQIINLTTGSQKAVGGASIQLDNPSGEVNIEYNRFINTGGIVSYSSRYEFNVRYNLFLRVISSICNAGGVTQQPEMVVKFNSFINIEGTILSLEPVLSPTMDATENYWGTTDTDAIDLKIHDGKDDVRIGSYITYMPILTSPHPSTPTP